MNDPLSSTLVIPDEDLHTLLADVVGHIIDHDRSFRSLLETSMGNRAPLHISLSPALQIPNDERHAFMDDLMGALKTSGVSVSKTRCHESYSVC